MLVGRHQVIGRIKIHPALFRDRPPEARLGRLGEAPCGLFSPPGSNFFLKPSNSTRVMRAGMLYGDRLQVDRAPHGKDRYAAMKSLLLWTPSPRRSPRPSRHTSLGLSAPVPAGGIGAPPLVRSGELSPSFDTFPEGRISNEVGQLAGFTPPPHITKSYRATWVSPPSGPPSVDGRAYLS